MHPDHQAFYSGDMTCIPKSTGGWNWRAFWGDNTGSDEGEDDWEYVGGVKLAKPKVEVFGDCRPFWCFADAQQVTINNIMKNYYENSHINWKCDRGVCYAQCSTRNKVAYVTHSGRTWQQSHFSCTDRAILTDFRNVPNNQRTMGTVYCDYLPAMVFCPQIQDQTGWSEVSAKYQIKSDTGVSLEFECIADDEVIVDSGTDAVYDATLPCVDGEWDATVWTKLQTGTECKKAICVEARRKRRETNSVVVSPRSAWGEWSECDVSCGNGKQFRSKFENDAYQWENQNCDTGVSCSYTEGCNDNNIPSWFADLIADPIRISCDELKCQAFCVDADSRPNGKLFYKSDYDFGWEKASISQKDWDGAMFCRDDWSACGSRSYGNYESSDSGVWCKPMDTSPQYECYDMPCAGFKDWATSATSDLMSSNDMLWNCYQGTCYPQCENWYDKAQITIGTESYDLPSLNCDQNPFFVHAIQNTADYDGVSFSCVTDHTKPPTKDGTWHIWGPCSGPCTPGIGEKVRYRNCELAVNGCTGGTENEDNQDKQVCTRTCSHKCGNLASATDNAPELCNTDNDKPAGTEPDKKECGSSSSYIGEDDPSQRELVCSNPNECRWTCKNRPNDPWYDQYMWHKFPSGVHIQHQVSWSGDMVCVKSSGNSYSWKPFWGESYTPLLSQDGEKEDKLTKPKTQFHSCRTFWCFADLNADLDVTIEQIMSGLYSPDDLSWSCDRGVCTATCSLQTKMPFVTHAGRTYAQAHFSCAHRAILNDFFDIPANQRDSNNIDKHLISCQDRPVSGPPECDTIDTFEIWTALSVLFDIQAGSSTAESVQLQCKDTTQTMSDVRDNSLPTGFLTCTDGVWDQNNVEILTQHVKCRDLSCNPHFTEVETYPCTDDIGDVTVTCNNDVCTASCPDGEVSNPPTVTCDDQNQHVDDFTHFECEPAGCPDISTMPGYDTLTSTLSFGPVTNNGNRVWFSCMDQTDVFVKNTNEEMAQQYINCETNNGVKEWNSSKWNTIQNSECRELTCEPNFSEESGFGSKPADVNIACNDNSCTITCQDNTMFPIPPVLDCTDNQSTVEPYCHKTPCGVIPFSNDDSQFTYTANDQNGCDLACVNGGVPNTKQWVCDQSTSLWENPFNHHATTRPLECIHTSGENSCGTDCETACGGIDNVINLSISVDVVCEEWVSIFDPIPHSCSFTCQGDDQTMYNGHGGNLVCDQGEWVDADEDEKESIRCCDSPCCSYNDASGYDVIDTHTETTVISHSEIEVRCTDSESHRAVDNPSDLLNRQMLEITLTCDETLVTDEDPSLGWQTNAWNAYLGPNVDCILRECPELSTMSGVLPDWDNVNSVINIGAFDEEMNRHPFDCYDTTQVLTKLNNQGDPDLYGNKWLKCDDVVWRDNHWNKMREAECRDLHCSGTFTETNGYGSKPADVIINCNNDACTLSCQDATKPYPHPPTLNCANFDEQTETYCHVSPCGRIPYSDDDSQFNYQCDVAGQCELACSGDKVPNTKIWQCDLSTEEWTNPFGHDSTTQILECIDDIETPCGNVGDVANILMDDIAISCDPWISIFDLSEHKCSFSCEDDSDHLANLFNSDLECTNGNWVNGDPSDKKWVKCCPSPCCEPEYATGYKDIDETENGFMTVNQIDVDTLKLECPVEGEIPVDENGETLPTTIVCDPVVAANSHPFVGLGWQDATWTSYLTGSCMVPQCPLLSDEFAPDGYDNVAAIIDFQPIDANGQVHFSCKDTTQMLTVTGYENDNGVIANDFAMQNQFLKCQVTEWRPVNKWEQLKHSECRDLSCHASFTEQTGFGTLDDGITITCDNDVCTVTCDDAKKSPFPPTINCDNIDPEPTITCEASPCGPIPHSTDDDQFTYSCNEKNVCTLSCDGDKVPNTKEWVCDTDFGTWENPFGHDDTTKPLECIDDIDTPCGNADEVTTISTDVTFTCEEWKSIYSTAEYKCTFSCSNDENLISIDSETFVDKLKCEKGVWTNSGTNDKEELYCCNSPCCSPTDLDSFTTITNKYDSIVFIDENTVDVSCQDGYVPVDKDGNLLTEHLVCDESQVVHDNPAQGWLGDTYTKYTEGSCHENVCPQVNTLPDQGAVYDVISELNRPTINGDLHIQYQCKDPKQVMTNKNTNTVIDSNLLKCDGTPLKWDENQWDILQLVECRDLPCTKDFTASAGYGSLPDGASVDCNAGTCQITCFGSYAIPSTIDCSNVDNFDEIVCHDSPCGPIPYSSDDSQFTYNCDDNKKNEVLRMNTNTCQLSCSGDKVPNTKSWECITDTKLWINTYGHHFTNRPLECIDDQDTPCGNVVDVADVDVYATYTCSDWISIFSNDEHLCSFTCDISSPHLYNEFEGDLACENKSWKDASLIDGEKREVECCASLCCDYQTADDFTTIGALVDVIEVDADTIQFICKNTDQIAIDSNGDPLEKELTCDATELDREGWSKNSLWQDYLTGSCIDNNCPDLSTLINYDDVILKLVETGRPVINGDLHVEFACIEPDQVLTDAANNMPFGNNMMSCSGAPLEWNEDKWNKFVASECRDLVCDKDFTEVNGNGNLPGGMTLNCANNECTATCDDGYPFPSVIDCDNYDQGAPVCHESPCGPIPYSTDDTQFTYNCNVQNVCTLTCANDQVANTKQWTCNPTTKIWFNQYNHHLTNRPLKCIDDVDTPCGNVQDYSTAITDVTYTCDDWVSVYDTFEHGCSFECQDPTKTQLINEYGGDLTCENLVWESVTGAVSCCASKCCNIEDTNNFNQLTSYLDYTLVDATTVKIECKDVSKVPIGGDDTTTTTTLTCNELQSINTYPEQGWETSEFSIYREDNGGKCVHLPCTPSDAANNFAENMIDNGFGDGNGEFSCFDGSCTAQCSVANVPNVYANYPTVDCSNIDEVIDKELKCQELPCTDVDSVLTDWGTDDTEFTIDCSKSWENQRCTIICVNTGEPAVPSVLYCDGDEYQPKQKPVCQAETECGFPSKWDYGPNWKDVTASCDDNICTLSCLDGKFPYPVPVVRCEAKVLLPCPFGADINDPSEGIDISCEVTPCGGIEQFGFDENIMAASCTTEGCTFTCDDDALVPNTISIRCNPKTKEWINEFSMETVTRPLECIDPVVTPCGNLEDVNIVLETNDLVAQVDVVCEQFNSVFDTEEKVCTIDCGQYHINGPEEYTCENGAFTVTDSTTQCCERICCGLDQFDFYSSIENKFDEEWNEEHHFAMFTCKDPTQVITNVETNKPIYDTRIGCDIYTQEWDTDHYNLLVNAECRDLPCISLFDEVDTLTRNNGAEINCDDGKCSVTCSLATHQYPIPSVLDCENIQSVIIDGSVTCETTPCGSPASFNYGASWYAVTVDCDNVAGTCDLFCPDGQFIYPIDQVMCIDSQLVPASTSLDIYCAQTKCGDINFIGFDDETMIADCTAEGCKISCVDVNLVPNTKEIVCHPLGLQFINTFDMDVDTRPLECITDIDTPCGNITDVVTLNEGVSYVCDEWVSIYDVTSNEQHCKLQCDDPNEVVYGHTTVITCKDGNFEQEDLNVHCWSPDTEDSPCGSINDIYSNFDGTIEWTCTGLECTPKCLNGLVSSAVTIICDAETGFYDVDTSLTLTCETVLPDQCGDLDDTFNIHVDVVSNCAFTNLADSEDSRCTFTCSNEKLPTVIDFIDCIDGDWDPSSLETSIECAETKCGNSEDWNFGTGFGDIDVTCDYHNERSTCMLDCKLENGDIGFVVDSNNNQLNQITCESDRTLLPAEGSLELLCAETPCGLLSNEVTLDADISISCTTAGCSFECPAGRIPTHFELKCINGEYQHHANSDQVIIECVDEMDTPCGNMEDFFNYDSAEVTITCDSFDSIYQVAGSSSTLCQTECVNQNYYLEGDNILVCANGKFVNTNKDISCAPTPCGDPADHVAIDDEVNYVCTNDTCSFDCPGVQDISIISNIICDAITKEFKTQVLWADTGLPFQVTEVICHNPSDPTFCSDPYTYFTNVDTNTAAFECDWETNICKVVCNAPLSDKYLPTIPQVHCNPNTRLYIEQADSDISCVERDTVCGDIDIEFTTSDIDLQWICVDNGQTTTCDFICDLEDYEPSVGSVTCDHDTGIYELSGGVNVATIECKPPEETDCGYLSDVFTISNDVIISCTDDGRCDFSCVDDTKFIDITTVFCHQGSTHYSPPGGVIECKGGYDTACGDLIDEGFLIESEQSCNDNVCTFACTDPAKPHLVGLEKAECLIDAVTGTRTYNYFYNVPSIIDGLPYSRCLETMCGELESQIVIDESITLSWNIDETTGYGSATFACAGTVTAEMTVSGLGGDTELVCPPTTGVWDLTSLTSDIKCSHTVCGDPSDIMTISDDATWTCDDNGLCTFDCGVDNNVNLEQLLCDQSTGEWITGDIVTITCSNECTSFGGTNSDFKIDNDVLVFCAEYEAGSYSSRCDLFCSNNINKPFVNETGEELTSVICRPAPFAPTNGWLKLDFDAFGIPRQSQIQGAGERHIICADKKPVDPITDECENVFTVYDIDDSVFVRCSTETCVFSCDEDKELNTEHEQVYCLSTDKVVGQRVFTGPVGIKPGWQPEIEHTIKCELKKDDDQDDGEDHDDDQDDGECGNGSDIGCHMCEPIEGKRI